MKNTDEILLSAGETAGYARQYLQQQGDLIRLEAAERISKTTSAVVTAVAIAAVAVLVVVMLSIAAGFWLGRLLESNATAFLIIGAVYFAAGLVIYFFRKKLIANPVLNFTLAAFFEDETDDD